MNTQFLRSFAILALILNVLFSTHSEAQFQIEVPTILAPSINTGESQRSIIQSIGVVFDQNVIERLSPSALTVRHIGTGEIFRFEDALIFFNPIDNSANWTIEREAAALLPDGNYIAWVGTDSLIDPAFGACDTAPFLDDFTFGFHQYAGDSDGDRDVDFLDSCAVRDSWLQSINQDRYQSEFDLNVNDQVASEDRNAMLPNWFTVLAPEPAIHLFLRNDTGDDLTDLATSSYNVGVAGIDIPEGVSWRASLNGGSSTSITNLISNSTGFLDEALLDQLNGSALTPNNFRLLVEVVNTSGEIIASDELPFEYLGEVNCAPFFVSTPPGGVALGSVQAAQPLNLFTWEVQQFPGSQGLGNWDVAQDGLSAVQTINARPSALISDQEALNLRIQGRFRVDTGGDDDLMGFIFGYQNSGQFYVFDWKQNSQPSLGGVALRGMSIKRFDANFEDFVEADFWWSNESRENMTILSPPNDIGWADFQDYDITLEFMPGLIVVEVIEEGILLDRLEVEDDTFIGGRFGFYNYSQDAVNYSGFTQQSIFNGYFYDSLALDPNGEVITYALVDGPEGMTIDSNSGVLLWEPTEAGTFPVTISATDEEGLSALQTFDVLISPFDEFPDITIQTTNPNIFPGDEITIQATGSDAEQLFRTRLFVDGIEIDPNTGSDVISTTTSFSEIGQVEIRAVAIDSAEQITERVAFVQVLDPSQPIPDDTTQGTITPPGQTTGGTADARPLASIEAPLSPTDASDTFIGSVSGGEGTLSAWFLEWSPFSAINPDNLSDQSILWQEIATDTNPISSSTLATIIPSDFPDELIAFRLRAENTNGLGIITSIVFNPNSSSTTGPTQTTETDPNNGNGSGIAASAAFTSPTSTTDDPLRIRGTTDANGGTLLSWTLDFAPLTEVNIDDLNDPTVVWTILEQGTNEFTDALITTIDDTAFPNDTFVFRLTALNESFLGSIASLVYNPVANGFSGPSNNTGNIPVTGARPVTRITSPLTPNDPIDNLTGSILGNSGTLERWVVDFALLSDVNPNDLNDPTVFWSELETGNNEIDNDLITPLDNPAFQTGIWVIRLRAFNENGLGNVSSTLLDTGDTSTPFAEITSPEEDMDITFLTPINGTVTGGDGTLASWILEVAPADQVSLFNLNTQNADWVEVASGTTAITDGELGVFDPTLLRNDSYVLRLSSFNTNGRGFSDGQIINVCGDAKLGNFRLEFEDLTIPLSGIPITIRRIYDTLDANRFNDFGFGWTLGLCDADIRETVPDTGADFFNATPFEIGTRVFLTTPEGRRVGFTFNVRNPQNRFIATTWEPFFEPDPGVYETLTIAPIDFERVEVAEDGAVFTPLLPFGYNPDRYRLTTREGLVYDYDQRSGLQRITDDNGQFLSFSNTQITHSSGQTIQIERDNQGRITTISDSEGILLQYQYDSTGDLVSFINPLGTTTRYSYFSRPAHLLSTVSTPEDSEQGRPSLQIIYENGEFDRILDSNGNIVNQQSFDRDSFTGTETDALGNTSTLTYNERGSILSVTSPTGFTQTFEYNDSLNPDLSTAVVDPNGNRTEMTYNSSGLPILEIRADGTETIFEYSSDNNPTCIEITDSNSNVLASVEVTYDTNGNPTELINNDGSTRSFQYDEQGRIVQLTDYDGIVQSLSYFPDNNSRKPNVIETENERLTVQYNSMGLPTNITDTSNNNEYNYTYNRTGQILTAELNGTIVSSITYDSNGRIASEESDGLIRTLSYDSSGNLLNETMTGSSSSLTTEYDYDLAGNLLSVTDPLGLTTQFTYNAEGRMITKTFPTGLTHSTSYDGNGNIIEFIDRRGLRTQYTYNERNQIIREDWMSQSSSNSLNSFETVYNDSGQATIMMDNNTIYRTSYNNAGLPATISNAGSVALPLTEFSFTYNENGLLTSVSDQDDIQIEQLFDDTGRVKELSWTGSPSLSGRTTFERTSEGLLTRINRFSSSSELNPFASTILDRNPIDLNIVGMRHVNANLQNLSPNLAFGYTRDANGRITQQSNGNQTIDYNYDTQGQLAAANYSQSSIPDESYSYDNIGNRTYSSISGQTVQDSFGDLISDRDFFYQYDEERNLTGITSSDGDTIYNLTYDHRNRLTTLEKIIQGTVATNFLFEYDPLNRLITRNINGEITHSSYFEKNLWADYNNSGAVQNRYFFSEQDDTLIARWDTTETVSWVLSDQIGSTRALVESDGTLSEEISYGSFGNILTGEPLLNNFRFGYTGREHLIDGIYNFRSRYYSANQGRFLSDDRIGFLGNDLNLKRYGRNDPLRFIDPLGTQSILSTSLSNLVTGFLQRASAFIALPLVQRVALGALAGAVFTPILDIICLLVSGQSDRISLGRIAQRATLGGLIGGAFAFIGGVVTGGAAAGGTAVAATPVAAEVTLAGSTFTSSVASLFQGFFASLGRSSLAPLLELPVTGQARIQLANITAGLAVSRTARSTISQRFGEGEVTCDALF